MKKDSNPFQLSTTKLIFLKFLPVTVNNMSIYFVVYCHESEENTTKYYDEEEKFREEMIEHFRHTYIMLEKCCPDAIDYFILHYNEDYFTNKNDRINYRIMIDGYKRNYSPCVFGFEQTFKMSNQKLYHCDSKNIEIYHKMKDMTTKEIIKVMINRNIQERAY